LAGWLAGWLAGGLFGGLIATWPGGMIYYGQKGLARAVKFVTVNWDTPMMFPPDLRAWLPEVNLIASLCSLKNP